MPIQPWLKRVRKAAMARGLPLELGRGRLRPADTESRDGARAAPGLRGTTRAGAE